MQPQLANSPLSNPGAVRTNADSSNLDVLRSLAVLFVFFAHLTTYFGVQQIGPFSLILMGTLGVMLFFVHTCFVLMMSLERRWKSFQEFSSLPAGNWIFFLDFMIRRCFRIYPLSIVVVLLIVIFRLPLASFSPGHFYGYTPDTGDIIANLFLVQNLSFRTPLLSPLWSLPYELQMYLFLPWLFLFLFPVRSFFRTIAAWIAGVGLALIVLHFQPNPSLPLFFPCFLPGVLAYQLQRVVKPRLPGVIWPLVILLPGLAFLASGSGMIWIQKWVLCLVIGMAIPCFRQIRQPQLCTAFHTIAKYSYGVYLTHFFCIWFAFEFMSGLPTILKVGVFLGISTGLPVVFYHLLEEPMLELGKKLADRYVREKLSPATRPPVLAGSQG
jgi:peptidoglycan/LPS O-acetylase OafA/YrhL